MSKAKESEAPSKVLEYLKNQNRPYSAGDVLMNLHKEFNKACIQRTLDQLVSNGQVKEKVYGKQKVYVIDQSVFPEVDEVQLKKIDQQIAELQSSLKTLQSEYQAKESKLRSLENSFTLVEARAQLESLEKECALLSERLSTIKQGGNRVSPEQSEQIRKRHKTSVDQWRKRKRMTMDIVNSILEGYPKSKKELMEEAGMETDEDCGVSLPPTT